MKKCSQHTSFKVLRLDILTNKKKSNRQIDTCLSLLKLPEWVFSINTNGQKK